MLLRLSWYPKGAAWNRADSYLAPQPLCQHCYPRGPVDDNLRIGLTCSFSGFSVARLACLSSISSICFQRTPSIRPFGSVPVPASQSYVMSHEGGALSIFSLFEQSGQRLFRYHATTAAQERTTVCWGPHCPNSCYYWPAGKTACRFHKTFFLVWSLFSQYDLFSL